MRVRGHDYRSGTKGRSFRIRGGVGGSTVIAMLQCSACPNKGERNFMTLPAPDQIDRKFIQHGWRIDPHLCPTCAAKPKEKPVASTPSTAAMKAQAQMFHLLSQHFDTVAGRYVADWSDAKIAKDTGLAESTVSAFRIAGFGEICEPTEVALIRQDIGALEKLQQESHATFVEEIAKLRGRLGEVRKAMGLRV